MAYGVVYNVIIEMRETTQEITMKDAVAAIIEDGEFGIYGIRAMTTNPITGKKEIVSVGDTPNYSYDWNDGQSSMVQLNGTCALAVYEVEEIEDVLEDIEQYEHDDCQIVLLGANSFDYGNDPGEIIMEEAEVILILK